jgi:alkanesulfonate monooxygenase SsuD/methylene tetrahydromethanopterin reductase-like flavin-dependent oxidoreductase (luciferase family)
VRYLDLWVRDEALGFEGIFFSEHHFGRSYSASPNVRRAVAMVRAAGVRRGYGAAGRPCSGPTRAASKPRQCLQ